MTDPTTLSDTALLEAITAATEEVRLASQRNDAALAATDAAIAAQGESLTAFINATRHNRALVNEANRRRL